MEEEQHQEQQLQELPQDQEQEELKLQQPPLQTTLSASQASKEKEAIGNLLAKKDGVELISMKSLNVRSYSEIWNKFSPIKFDLTEQDLIEKGIRYKICKTTDGGEHMYISKFYVTCNECLKLFVHDTVSKGTSHLSNHLKTCGQTTTPKKKISQGPRPPKDKRRTIVKQSRNGVDTSQFDEKLVNFLSQGLKLGSPISIIEDPSFRSLLQECITLGSIYGNFDVDLLFNKAEWYEQRLLEKYVEHLSSVKSRSKQ